MNSNDEMYMIRVFNLARKGEGFVNPNPLGGAVIVKDGKIISEGYHKFFGGPHAEVYALGDAGIKARDAELYVNMEPCSKHGKTPPCVDAILKAGIKRVVIATKDPNQLLSGKAVRFLSRCGVEVVTGVLENEAKKLNEIYIKYKTTGMPFVVMKTVMGLDGSFISDTGESEYVLCDESRDYLKKVRNKFMGIMMGIDTLIMDDPTLTVRLKEKPYISPKAIIIDPKLEITEDANILSTIKEREIIIACTQEYNEEKRVALETLGVKIIVAPKTANGRVDIEYVIKALGTMGIDSIVVEGGSELSYTTIGSQVIDKVMCFIIPKILNSSEKNSLNNFGSDIYIKNMTSKKVGSDMLIEGYI